MPKLNFHAHSEMALSPVDMPALRRHAHARSTVVPFFTIERARSLSVKIEPEKLRDSKEEIRFSYPIATSTHRSDAQISKAKTKSFRFSSTPISNSYRPALVIVLLAVTTKVAKLLLVVFFPFFPFFVDVDNVLVV